MNDLILNTYYQKDDATLGMLYIDEVPRYFTIERPYCYPRVRNESSIYPGRYEIVPRTRSGKVDEYKARFDWFRYHLQLKDVPDADHILIHIANGVDDVRGCIGIANGADLKKHRIVDSTTAFKEFSLMMYEAFDRGESAWIEVNRLAYNFKETQ